MALQGQFTGGGEVEFKLRVDTSELNANLNNTITKIEILERTLSQAVTTFAKFTGSEDLQTGSRVLVTGIALINQFQLASNLLLSTNPWLWPLGILGFANIAVSAPDMIGSYV